MSGSQLRQRTFRTSRSGNGCAVARRARGDAGFTLIELLVVLAILGMLAAIATPQVLKYLGSAKLDTTRIEIANIGTALDMFLVDNGRYPTQQEGLDALTSNPQGLPTWRGPYVKSKGAPLDPWGRAYQYRIPGQHGPYDLYSLGPDGNGTDTQAGGKPSQLANW